MTSDRYLKLEREGTGREWSYVTSIEFEMSNFENDVWMVLEAWLIVSCDSVMRPHSAEFSHARINISRDKRSAAMDIDWIGEYAAQEIEVRFMKELQEGE
tara:strand:+ start:336 stop:635 length:300 start_codon:yes stop_codon:yes gene_type:complete